MKSFDVKYVRKNDEGFSRHSTERLDAKGIMHAWKLAKDHAKAIDHQVESVREIFPEEGSKLTRIRAILEEGD